jgi:hypothetical protein
LEGDFRSTLSPFRERLDAELKNIHLPLGTPVAFCLVTNTGTRRLHVGKVHLENGIKGPSSTWIRMTEIPFRRCMPELEFKLIRKRWLRLTAIRRVVSATGGGNISMK